MWQSFIRNEIEHFNYLIISFNIKPVLDTDREQLVSVKNIIVDLNYNQPVFLENALFHLAFCNNVMSIVETSIEQKE